MLCYKQSCVEMNKQYDSYIRSCKRNFKGLVDAAVKKIEQNEKIETTNPVKQMFTLV